MPSDFSVVWCCDIQVGIKGVYPIVIIDCFYRLVADGNETIAGVVAQKYSLAGLVSTEVVYFDNNGVGYQIESGTGDLSQAMFADLIADWAFTP